MKTPESELAKLPMAEEANGDQGKCEVDANVETDIPHQSWQLAIEQDQTDPQGNPQPTLVAYPSSQAQRQAVHPISLDRCLKQPIANQQSCAPSGNIWHTTPLPPGPQVIPQMPTFLNCNNNASRGVSLAPNGLECSHISRPSVGLVQQVVECFKQSAKKEMLPSEVYVEMENVFPFYKHIVGQKRKSWMSSVRHALTTPRFKSRKISRDEKEIPKRGCLWSLNEDFDENAPINKTPRRQRTPNPLKVTRRKQRFLGNTRNDYTPPLYHMNRNNATFFQPQQHVAQRYPYIEIPDSAPMQATFSPGPTGPMHAGGNMYYQPYRAPTVGYVIAGQKMAMPQQAMQPVNMGQWNVSGFSACNQQQYMPNNAAFYGGNNAMMHNNQNNNQGMQQAFGPAVMPTMVQTNQNNNATASGIPEQQQAPQPRPTPVSIQTAEHTIENSDLGTTDITMCDVIQADGDMTEENQVEEFPNQQSESQVHDDIKKELRSLVYESLDLCNSQSQRSNPDCEVDTTSTQTMQQALQVNRSPTWARSKPPHHAKGGFHNYAWSPLSHQSQNQFQGPVAPASEASEELQGQDQEGSCGARERTEILEARIIEGLDGQVVVHASISNECLDLTNDQSTN